MQMHATKHYTTEYKQSNQLVNIQPIRNVHVAEEKQETTRNKQLFHGESGMRFYRTKHFNLLKTITIMNMYCENIYLLVR